MGGGDDAEGGALVAKAAVESHIAAVVREESTRLHPAPASPASPDAGAKKKLGTIKGVFVPTMQNILGVILFLRVPFIVGQAGILEGLAIVWLSCATTLLTSISMSAIATNGVPRGGGCYTMIKNALGAQFGGVTGILLFLSNTFGVAMYVLGCVEVLKDCFPAVFEGVNDRLLGVAVLASLSLIVFVGVEYIARFAVVFLAGVVLSVLSIQLVLDLGRYVLADGLRGAVGQRLQRGAQRRVEEGDDGRGLVVARVRRPRLGVLLLAALLAGGLALGRPRRLVAVLLRLLLREALAHALLPSLLLFSRLVVHGLATYRGWLRIV